MLLNLSNHKFQSWQQIQKDAAESEFGIIKDMDFPQVPPPDSTADIIELANDYAERIVSLFKKVQTGNKTNAVHVMGELTFCYQLINILKEKGIRCVASTTKRISVQNDTQRLSEFVFTRFRDYF